MNKTIYHGSEKIIKTPVYGEGKPYNDYGLGFYCTEDQVLASEWAVDKDRDGYVNQYQIDLEGLNILNLNSGKYTVLHWLSVLISNRHFDLGTPLLREAHDYLRSHFFVDLSNVDVVIGYRADDSYFSFAQDFLGGQISLSQLSSALYLGNLGEQIMIKSRRAFNLLEFIESRQVYAMEWYSSKKARDDEARNSYRRINKQKYVPGELYMIKIIDEEIGSDDPRIQRIVFE